MSDKLDKMFKMQEFLNNKTFAENDIVGKYGQILEMKEIIDEANDSSCLGNNDLPNKWINLYLTAMEDECRELKDELKWKWWSKDKLNMQNIRVEIVDQLHFWMSIAMSAGMSAEDVFRIYEQKNKVNLARQDNGYNATDKTEDDNKGIK